MQRPFNLEPLLRLEAVRLTLMSQAGPVNILNGIDLKVAKGEAIGLVGPSGSGKSTLLMVMSGLERPTSGKVTVAGQELSKFDEDAAARFRRGNVGIVFQSFHLIPTMTALENVAVPLELALVPNAFDRALEELKALGLGHRVDHYPSQLSGGEQQRVALARAIAPRPGLLFADEPTGNLDGRTGSEIMSLMFAMQKERGTTLVLVTHDEELVRRCDRIVRLRDGRIDGIETIEHTSTPIMMPSLPAGKFEPVVTVDPHRHRAVEPAVVKDVQPPAPEPSPPPPSVEAMAEPIAPLLAAEVLSEAAEIIEVVPEEPIAPSPPAEVVSEAADIIEAVPAEPIAASPPAEVLSEAAEIIDVGVDAPEPAAIESEFAPQAFTNELPQPAPPEMELAIETPDISEVAPINTVEQPPQAMDAASDTDPVAEPPSDETPSAHDFRRVAAGGE